MRPFRLIAALVVWSALLLQYYLITEDQTGAAFAYRTVNYFSYFTIITNLLAAMAFTAPSVAPASPPGLFFARPAVRTGIVLYTSVTAATYILILQGLWNPQGLDWVADITLHYVTPALFLFDWLVFTPKGTLGLRAVWPWLILPLAYGAYSIVRGPLSGFYPYPFLDVSQHGMNQVLINMAAMSALFLALGLVFIAIDRLMRPRGG